MLIACQWLHVSAAESQKLGAYEMYDKNRNLETFDNLSDFEVQSPEFRLLIPQTERHSLLSTSGSNVIYDGSTSAHAVILCH